MAVRNPDGEVVVTFLVDDIAYHALIRRGQIVHEAIDATLPPDLAVGHRLTFRTPGGAEIFADNFIGDVVDHYDTAELVTTVRPIEARPGAWRNVGFDHLAITVEDRTAARDFFRDVLQLEVMRHDAHITVLATGHTALFLFDAGQAAPLSSGQPSSWHHLGFVVDDLEATYAHLQGHQDRLMSDFTLLERDERWSLYCFYRNGGVTLMIQLSEIKPEWRGFSDPGRAAFPTFMYDYAARPYGVQWEAETETIEMGRST
ncbi:MAG: VOC family protein [Thermomicrobiales bacterium]